jgi:hypothetical protein
MNHPLGRCHLAVCVASSAPAALNRHLQQTIIEQIEPRPPLAA